MRSTYVPSGKFLVWLTAGLLIFSVWSWSLAWHEPILDRHEFRQVQTADTAYWLKETGWKLNYETPLFGPPWSIPMEFPIYQGSVAALSHLSGLSIESAGRITSIAFMLATLPAIYLLAGIFGLLPSRRLLVVAAVLTTPVYLFYARTLMIETTALCFSAWFLIAIGYAARDLNSRWAAGAAIFGVLAALAKVTTFAVFCFPAAGLALWLAWPRLFGSNRSGLGWVRTSVHCAVPVIAAVMVGAWWVRYADAIKQSNPYSGFLTSMQMAKWNWGTLDQRVSSEVWLEFWRNVTQFVLSDYAILLLLICATLVTSRARRYAFAATAAFLTGPLVFSSLYFHHDYYYSANALLLLFGAGLLLAAIWDASKIPPLAKYTIVILFFSAQLLIFYQGYSYNYRREIPPPPEIATAIRVTTDADDVVIIYGWDWNALVPYYAQRRAVMIPGGRDYDLPVLETILSRIDPHQITGLLIRTSATPASPEFMANRVTRFGLSPFPVATSADGDLYLRTDLAGTALSKLKGISFKQVTVNTAGVAAIKPVHLIESDPRDLDLSFLNPRPYRGQSQFGLKAIDHEGTTVLFTHPRAHLYFHAPDGASSVRIEVGILADAYRPGDTSITDGITIELALTSIDGVRRVLKQQSLDPAKLSTDRGTKKILWENLGSLNGELEIYLSPGPLGNISNDWAYVAGVTIE